MFTFLDYAQKVLENSNIPLSYQEIWQKGLELGLDKKLSSYGKTPWQTLGARLFCDVRDNTDSMFTKVSKRPARFFLKSKVTLLSKEIINNINDKENQPIKKENYNERALHPLLSYFAYTMFNKGKAIFTKTIFHEKSKKSGLNEWLHPDIVGVYLPIDDWSDEIIDLNKVSNSTALTLFSFEIKKEINRSNYRESFFQAVSNSSWANEGYLVAGKIVADDELMSELARLSTSFGIGLIELDLEDIASSKVVFASRQNRELDWDTMNKLCEINSDFQQFIQNVKIDLDAKKIHKSEYDEILSEPQNYIKEILR